MNEQENNQWTTQHSWCISVCVYVAYSVLICFLFLYEVNYYGVNGNTPDGLLAVASYKLLCWPIFCIRKDFGEVRHNQDGDSWGFAPFELCPEFITQIWQSNIDDIDKELTIRYSK